MDLTSDRPFWLLKNGLIAVYPALANDVRCEVAVLGAGISGAIIADRLAKEGLNVVVLDKRDVCLGSTCASTALLQYEIDVSLIALSKKIGLENARRVYQLSHSSIDSLSQLATSLSSNCDFKRMTSIYLASDKRNAQTLEDEAKARVACGIKVELLKAGEIRERFAINGTAAIVSTQAASVDPYRFAHLLLARAKKRGARIYDRTIVSELNASESHVDLLTDKGHKIKADKVVIATGYEAQSWLTEKVVHFKNTYAVVSQPLASLAPWNEEWMLWESKNPYLYLRATADRRILAGGEDDPFRNSIVRDRRLARKAEQIRIKINKLLPSLKWEVEFAWAGTFGETDDGLAYIGETRQYPHCYFMLGFGGNGITFSAIGSDLIVDMVKGIRNIDAHLFRFGR